MQIIIEVRGDPVPQGRPRAARIGKFVRVYDPPESKEWKDDIKAQAIAILNRDYPDWKLVTGPIRLYAEFRLSRPKSISEKKRPEPIVKPDGDNLLKAVKDALTGILWHDDCQITKGGFEKVYADPPGVKVWIWFGDEIHQAQHSSQCESLDIFETVRER